MRHKITVKLFVLTAVMFTLVLALVYAGQSVFFRQYYLKRTLDKVAAHFAQFVADYTSQQGDELAVMRLKERFFNDNQTWVAILDRNGTAVEREAYYVQGVEATGGTLPPVPGAQIRRPGGMRPHAEGEDKPAAITIPLNNALASSPDYSKLLRLADGKHAADDWARSFRVTGIRRGDQLVPIEIAGMLFTWTDAQLKQELAASGIGSEQWTEMQLTVTNAVLPTEIAVRSMQRNDFLSKGITSIQAKLLANRPFPEDKLTVIEDGGAGFPNRTLLMPLTTDGAVTGYAIGVVFVQPIQQFMGISVDFYLYSFAAVGVLVLLMSFYYSRIIARPLLRLNRITTRMARLDFSETVPVRSRDEIGTLSANINQLSGTLKSHIDRLEVANAELQQDVEKERKLERTRKEFIAGVSHELKTPLSIIQTCVTVLKEGIAQHKSAHYYAAIEEEIRRMSRLINDMLELAKMESGTYRMETELFSMTKLLEANCRKLQFRMEEKRLRWVWERADEGDVVANVHLMEQVLRNMMDNAIRYTPPGNAIHLGVEHTVAGCRVSLENKGVHLPHDKLDKLWDRFYRLDEARQRGAGGTGLGLAIAKRILELHGAEYGVRNTDDGVRFYFIVPAVTMDGTTG